MKQVLKSILNRLNNKGTILAIVGLLLNLCIQLGFQVETERITNVINIICTILVSLGILNDPTNGKEGYIPGISDKLVNDKKENTTKIEEGEPTIKIDGNLNGLNLPIFKIEKGELKEVIKADGTVINKEEAILLASKLKADNITTGVLNTEPQSKVIEEAK